jgi:hypothetical protein
MDSNTLYLFNTTIAVPAEYPAMVKMDKLTAQEATELLQGEFVSAIGHQGSADAIEATTGVKPVVSRIQASWQVGDRALCFKLNGRLPEGAIISAQECQEIGFEFILMERVA